MEWALKPALQILKKTGEPGRVVRFDRMKLTEPAPDRAALLLKILEELPGKAGRFTEYFGSFRDVLESLLFREARVPLRLAEIVSVRFSFLPVEEGGASAFACHAEIESKEGPLSLRIDRDPSAFFSSPSAVCFTGGDLLVGRSDDFLLHQICSAVRSRDGLLRDPSVIGRMAAAVKQEGRTDIIVERRIPKRVRSYPVPVPILDVGQAEEKGRTSAELVFSYDGCDAVFDEPPDLLEVFRDGEALSMERNRPYERALKECLWSFFRRNDIRWSEASGLVLEQDLAGFLMDHGRDLMSEGFRVRMKGSRRDISGAGGTVSLSVASGIDWFDVRADYSEKTGGKKEITVDPELLVHGLVKAGDGYVFLKPEDIALLSRLSESSSGGMKVPKADVAALAALAERTDDPSVPELARAKEIVEKLADFKRIEKVTLPASFKADLRDYQKAGLDWLMFLHEYGLNGCLADDMGLGKTVQALGLLEKLRSTRTAGWRVSVVVCPVSLLGSWQRETERFAPKMKCFIHTGPDRPKRAKELEAYDLILVSYHTLRNDCELFQKLSPFYLVLDEAQAIKNHATDIFRAVRSIPSDRRLSLTGTPVENNTLELWAQMDFLNPGLLGPRSRFQARFGRIDGESGQAEAETLRKTVTPFILRRKKEAVLKDLPGKQETVLYSEMAEDQAALYETNRLEYSRRLEKKIEQDGVEKSGMEILSALLRLRQIALFPELTDPKFKRISSCKFDQFREFTSEVLEEGHKILVFSQFTELLGILAAHFDEAGVKYSYLDGSMDQKKRQAEIDRFQEKGETGLFLLSLKAGGKGLTLTAADYVILFDPWWNPAVEMQAVDRCCRIGQTRKVLAYRLITKGTVEEKMLALQERKRKLVEDVVAAESGVFKNLKKEDILSLFA
jgi:superfamily II DNA or RNA helicase